MRHARRKTHASTFPGDRHRGRGSTPIVMALAALAGAAVCLGGARAAQARAKLLDLHVGAVAGGMTGRGVDNSTPDFFHLAQGPAFGAEVGLRFLVLDLSIRFVQLVDSSGRAGTLSTVMFGPSVEIPIVSRGERPVLLLRPGIGVGFGFGTPLPVDLPLSNDQISGKGLLVVGRFQVERMFGPVFGLGVEAQGGYHYFFGADATVNDQKSHSSGWQIAAFGMLTFHFGI
jgi:hypothetical protein